MWTVDRVLLQTTDKHLSSADKHKVHLHRSLGDINQRCHVLVGGFHQSDLQIYLTSVVINTVADK